MQDTTLVAVGYKCQPADLVYLEAFAGHFREAIFVDNGPAAHSLSTDSWRTVVSGANVGFGAAANRGAELACTSLLLFLNPDARLDPATAVALRAALVRDPSLAAVGPNLAAASPLRGPNAGGARKTLAHALVFAFVPARCLQRQQIWRSSFPDAPEPVLVDWVSAACLLIRREAFAEAGGFPLDYFLYDEDVALGLTLTRAGHRLGVAGGLQASHRVGGSHTLDEHFRRWALSNQRHIVLTSRSRPRAALTLFFICVGLLRRAGWRAFLGRSNPHRYAYWAIRYLVRYGLRLPPAGEALPG